MISTGRQMPRRGYKQQKWCTWRKPKVAKVSLVGVFPQQPRRPPPPPSQNYTNYDQNLVWNLVRDGNRSAEIKQYWDSNCPAGVTNNGSCTNPVQPKHTNQRRAQQRNEATRRQYAAGLPPTLRPPRLELSATGNSYDTEELHTSCPLICSY